MYKRDKRTPEEIAAIREVVNKLNQKHDKEQGLKKINQGRIALVVLIGSFLLEGFLYAGVPDLSVTWITLYVLISIYVLLWYLYLKNPLIVSIIALSIFVLLILLAAINDPSTIIKGLLLKVIVFVLLISAIVNATKYREELNKQKIDKSDILDA